MAGKYKEGRFALWTEDSTVVIDFLPMKAGLPPLMLDLRMPEAGWRVYNSTFGALKYVRWLSSEEVEQLFPTPPQKTHPQDLVSFVELPINTNGKCKK